MRILVALCAWLLSVPAVATGPEPATGEFLFSSWPGPPLRVLYSRPQPLTPDRPVVMVLHGQSRTADIYRDQWHELAVAHNFLLIVPEFSRDDFPSSRAYNLGNLVDLQGGQVPRERWSFSVPVALFEAARARFSMAADRFALYGHSAGAQFVHRFLMHVPDAPVSRAVAANAGWYTMPTFDVGWPYGLAGSRVGEAALGRLLSAPLTILLGEADILTDEDNLNRSAGAMRQGPHRLARGRAYFTAGERAAQARDLPFGWRLATVPGAGHDNAKMAPAAIEYLLGD